MVSWWISVGYSRRIMKGRGGWLEKLSINLTASEDSGCIIGPFLTSNYFVYSLLEMGGQLPLGVWSCLDFEILGGSLSLS